MKPIQLIPVALLAAAGVSAAAQAPSRAELKRVFIDLSSEAVIDTASAKAILGEAMNAKVRKLYPPRKYGFVSEVTGGITKGGICVVTARVMVAPLSASNQVKLIPEERAAVFDAMPGATQEQCRQLAKDKLREAAEAMASNLVKR